MKKKVLIVYSSWSGSTREIAEFIGKSFQNGDISADVFPADGHSDPGAYDAVIIGTSIHASRTVGSFKKFLRKYRDTLSEKKVAVFVACANMMNDTQETRAETMGWLDNAIRSFPEINPLSIGLFGGATITSGESFDKLNIFVKRIIEAMQQNMVSEYGKADFRDWDKIASWVEDLKSKI